MVRYLNWRGPQGRETVDQINREDFATLKAYREEVSRLVGEYAIAGMDVYISSRPCANWA